MRMVLRETGPVASHERRGLCCLWTMSAKQERNLHERATWPPSLEFWFLANGRVPLSCLWWALSKPCIQSPSLLQQWWMCNLEGASCHKVSPPTHLALHTKMNQDEVVHLERWRLLTIIPPVFNNALSDSQGRSAAMQLQNRGYDCGVASMAWKPLYK